MVLFEEREREKRDEFFFSCRRRAKKRKQKKKLLTISFSTSTVPGLATRPTSFLPRSTSITCSARSLASASSSFSKASSAAGSAPLARVPARGLLVTLRSAPTRQRISGELATRIAPRHCR